MNVRKFANKTVAAIGGSVSLAASLLSPSIAGAQTGSGGDILGNLGQVQTSSGLSSQALPTLVGRYINALLGILGVFFVVLIIYAGFTYLNARGDAKKTTEAIDMIKNAVIGLIIIFAAYAISNFVISAVLTASGT